MKIFTIWSLLLSVLIVAGISDGLLFGEYSVVIHHAERIQFPGIVHRGGDPESAGDVDCSSPRTGTVIPCICFILRVIRSGLRGEMFFI